MSRNEADTEAFIRKAEELRARLGRNALDDEDDFLEPQQWASECDTTAELYVEFHHQVQQSLAFLVANPDAELPRIVRFLATAELEKLFPPLDPSSATYGPVTATIKYVSAKVLLGLLSGSGPPPELAARADRAFEALWALPGAERMETREALKADEAMLDLAFGRHEDVVRAYEQEHRFDLAKHESAARTAIKECYMLARIAAGTADQDLMFGARSYIALLAFDYWLWKVNEERSAEIGLVPLVLMRCLYERIVHGRVPGHRELFASMAPRRVVEEMESLERA